MEKKTTGTEVAKNTSLLDVTQAAADWAERGVFCVPLHKESKKPKGERWQHLRLVDADFRKAFKPGDNIGGLWGEPSDWAIDLDLDLETAPLVAQHFLREYETFIYGRREKRASHYVFRCVGAVTLKLRVSPNVNDPDGNPGMVVEIRSTGAQSVLPPSKHPDGDRYFIEHDVEFFDISVAELTRLAYDISIAALFLQFYPTGKHSGRHDYVHACTGALCHAKWKPKRIKAAMAAVLSEVVGEDEEIKDRMGSVINTIDHAKNDDHIMGLTTLKDYMPALTISTLRKWLKVPDAAERLEDPGLVQPKKRSLDLDFKKEWLEVPGLIGDVAKWSSDMAYLRQPVYDLAAGIMCTSLASANNYLVDVWDAPLSPYIMIVGATASGKDAPQRAIATFADELGITDRVADGFQSFYALLDKLGEDPCAVLLWDEAARQLAAAKSTSGPDYTTITHLIKLYGAGNKIVPATPGRKNPIPALEYPFLTVLATAQPDKLMEALDKDAEDTGFVNRFLLFDTWTYDPPRTRKANKLFPSALKRQGKLLLNHEPTPGQEFTRIGFDSNKTLNMFDAFEAAQRKRLAQSRDNTWGRANQNALILAGLAAVSTDPHSPVITEENAKWAMEIVTWSCDCWTERLKSLSAGDRIEKESHRIETVIRNPLNYLRSAADPRQAKQLAQLKEGFMPTSVLLRVTRNIVPRRREEILDDLHKSGVIGSMERDGVTLYFAK